MELLIFLVGRREQMVSREDIVKKLWRSDLLSTPTERQQHCSKNSDRSG